MKKWIAALVLIVAVLVAAPASAQTSMTTLQKVKLTVVPTPAATIPAGTLMVWSIDGATAANPLGTFQNIAGEFAVWYLPVAGGSHVVRVSLVVGGQTFGASYPITVTVPVVMPTSVAIVASAPVVK